MADLFRGYDLTTVVDTVAKKQYQRMTQDLPDGQFFAWDDLPAIDKRNFKERLLPLVTDVLDALEAGQAVAMETKKMVPYGYDVAGENRTDGRFYENQPHNHDAISATVWALHLNVRQEHLAGVLERMAVIDDVTGEYGYEGDSFKEWGTATTDPDDQHLVIYFEATPGRARVLGDQLADLATFAVEGFDPSIDVFERYISTAGSFVETV